MAIVSKSNQVLYTGQDYVSALQSASRIEKAVALVEKGNSVLNFSTYIDEYTKLMKRLVSTNDLGHNVNPNMRRAHYNLMQQVQGLEKRVVAACVQAKVVPPSQDLIEMLKVDQNLSPRPVKSKWTTTAIVKYSAMAGAAALAYSPLLSAIAKIPSFFAKTVLTTIKVVPQAGRAANDAYTAAYNAFTNVGNGVNALRDLGSKAGISTLTHEDPTALGAGTLIDLLFKQFMWKSAVKPILQPILPHGMDSVINTGITLSTVCDATIPDCTKNFIHGVKLASDIANDNPGVAAVAALGVGIPVIYYSADIVQSLSSAVGYAKPIGFSIPAVPLATTALAAAMKSASPELYTNLTKQYPYMIETTNIFGIAGSIFGPWYKSGAITAAANAAAQVARNAEAVVSAAKVASTNTAIATTALPQNAIMTPAMHELIQKAGQKAFDNTVSRQRYGKSLMYTFTFAVLPSAFEGLKVLYKSCTTKDASCNNACNNAWEFSKDYVDNNQKTVVTSASMTALSLIGGIYAGCAGYQIGSMIGLTTIGAVKMGAVTCAAVASTGIPLSLILPIAANEAYKAIAPVVSQAMTASANNGVIRQVTDYTTANYKTSVASGIVGLASMILGAYCHRSRAGLALAFTGAALTHGASQGYQAIAPVVSQAMTASATNGVIRQVMDYTTANYKTSVASGIIALSSIIFRWYHHQNPAGLALTGAALTHAASQGYQAIAPVVTQSATNGRLKDGMDYLRTVNGATVVSGILGTAYAVKYPMLINPIHSGRPATTLQKRIVMAATSGLFLVAPHTFNGIYQSTTETDGYVNRLTHYAVNNPRNLAIPVILGILGILGYRNRQPLSALGAMGLALLGTGRRILSQKHEKEKMA